MDFIVGRGLAPAAKKVYVNKMAGASPRPTLNAQYNRIRRQRLPVSNECKKNKATVCHPERSRTSAERGARQKRKAKP